MSDSPAPPGGAFLADPPQAAQVSLPGDVSAEGRLTARTAEEFLRREILPVREQLEAQEAGLMRRLVQQAGTLGLLAANVPTQYGGSALPKTTAALIGEKMAGDLSFAVSAGIHSGVALLPLALFETPEQKARWLPRMARGDVLGAFALSEANSGSDALSARAQAALSADGTHYLLHGVKQWITNAGFADVFTVFAKVEGRQFSPFLVERTSPGVSFGPEEKKLGLRGSSTRRMILEGVRVPVENVIGEVAAKEALRLAAEYAGERRRLAAAVIERGSYPCG